MNVGAQVRQEKYLSKLVAAYKKQKVVVSKLQAKLDAKKGGLSAVCMCVCVCARES